MVDVKEMLPWGRSFGRSALKIWFDESDSVRQKNTPNVHTLIVLNNAGAALDTIPNVHQR
jgi:hypothetical protein